MTLLKSGGYAKMLKTGSTTYRLGDWGDPVEPGKDYTKLNIIRIDDIVTGLVSYTLKWYLDGSFREEASFTFGGTFLIEWE